MLRASRKFARVSNFVAAAKAGRLGSTCQIFNVAAGTKKLRRQSNFKKLEVSLYLYFPFKYNKNLNKSQAGSRVKFSGADILLQLKFWFFARIAVYLL